VLTQARRFEDLKVEHEGKPIEDLAPLEAAVRPLAKLAPAPAPGGQPTLTLVETAPTSAE
jgi:DNA recombination protein RmuC